MNTVAYLSLFFVSALGLQSDLDVTATNEKTTSTAATLERFGVEPTAQGIRAYLKSLFPTSESTEQTQKLIGLLSHSKFAVREDATQKLMLLPSVDGKLAVDMLDSTDPETAFRIEAVIEFRKLGAAQLQKAVFNYVYFAQLKGLAKDIVEVRDYIHDEFTRRRAFRAMEVSAVSDEFKMLEQLFIEYKNESRYFATSCLKALQNLDAEATTKTILSQRDADLNDFVKLTAAQILAQNKNSECLNMYVSLLNSAEQKCRIRAYGQLGAMTGKQFEYSVMSSGEKLDASIKHWRKYIAESHEEIEIQFQPLGKRLGRMLVCSYTAGEIHSYDENGKLKWSAKGDHAFTCQGLPNGNCLVMLYSKGKLREYDEEGNLLKEFSDLPNSISSIQRLENGNTLLASGQSGNQIIEIDPDGNEVWSRKLDGMPTGARLQENGLIVATLFGERKIVEIDRKGVVQNEFKVKGQPYTVNVTFNDTFLVAFSDGGVAEFTRSGKELLRVKTSTNTYWAEQMEDGSIITADSTGILKIDQDGKINSLNDKYKNYTYVSSY